MRTAVIDAPRSLSVISASRPTVGPRYVLVRIAYVGLCGTDLELAHGTSQYLVDGRASYPHRFGHEWVGSVVTTGVAVDDLAVGEVVTGSTMIHCQSCRECSAGRRNLCSGLCEVGLYGWPGAAADFLAMPRHAVVSLGRPDGGPRPAHVLIEPLVTVLEALAHTELAPGTTVLVVGAGTIGSLAAVVLSRYPVTVEILEPGALPHLDPLSYRRHHRSPSEVASRAYDVVVECSGAPGMLGESLRAAVPGGLCLLVGVAVGAESVDPAVIALDGLRIVGVRHGVDHYHRAARLVTESGAQFDALVDEVVPLRQVDRAFALLERGRTRPKVVIDLG